MNNATNWYGLTGKRARPVCIGILLLVFSQEAGTLYDILIERIEKGSAVQVGGLFKLGEATGKTEVSELLFRDPPIQAIGGMAVDSGSGFDS